ncbi:hypothetical protein ESCOCK373M_12180 [Escherichia coli]
MFRGNLQITADVMGRQLFDIARIFYGDVITHTRGDEDLFNAFQITRTAIEIDGRFMVSVHVRTNIRINARQTTAGLLSAWRFAAQHIHVGSRPTEIGNHARKTWNSVADRFDLINNRIFGTALNNAPFVLGNRTERAAAKAATHNVDRETNHFVSRNSGITVSRMRHALVRQRKDAIHLFGRKRNSRRVDPYIAVAMFLHQCAGAAWVSFVVQNARSMGVQHFIALHFLERRQQHVGFFPRFRAWWLHGYSFGFLLFRSYRFVIRARQIFAIRMRDWVDFPWGIKTGGIHTAPAWQRLFYDNRGITHIADFTNRLAHRQTVRHFHQRTLTVTKHQHVGFRIHQHGTAHGIGPVIIMRGTAQAGLNTAEDHRHIFPRLFTTLGINQCGAIRTLTRDIIWRVGIVMT